MWDLIVLVPDHCLSFYFQRKESEVRFTEALKLKVLISSIQSLMDLREFRLKILLEKDNNKNISREHSFLKELSPSKK